MDILTRSVENWPEAVVYSMAVIAIAAIIITFLRNFSSIDDEDETE